MTLLPSFPPAVLALSDGTLFRGYAIGVPGSVCGEVVFNTAMTGYQEVMTDPSCHRQIVAFSYPHIGNVGCNDEDFESRANHVAGLVIRDLPVHAENWRMQETLPAYLKKYQIIGIAGIDTRALIRLLREKGVLTGCIMAGQIDEQEALARARQTTLSENTDLASEVSTRESYVWKEGAWDLNGFVQPPSERFHVLAYDFGLTRNCLRLLAMHGCRVTVVPAQTAAEAALKFAPDGIFLSGGPGDPAALGYAVDAIGKLLDKRIPVFGVGLGHLLLAVSSGAKIIRMPLGRHGANHPVKSLDCGKVMITRQNQEYAVDASTLPDNLKVTHLSLFDGFVQGIERTDVPAFSFHGNPDAGADRGDKKSMLARFIRMMQERKLGEK